MIRFNLPAILLAGSMAAGMLLLSCGREGNEAPSLKQFTLMPPDSTGIFFANRLHDTREVNYTFEYRYNGSGVAVGDINNDGLQDLFFAANDEKCRLYLNNGNLKFQDITETAGILPRQSLSSGVQMVDINADGFMDIYVCRTGLFRDPNLRANQLYINNGNLTFTEKAAAYGLDDRSFSNHTAFFDYDRDHDLDMYLVNGPLDYMTANNIKMRPDTDRVGVSDRLYRNNGDGSFTEVTFEAGVDNKAHGFNPLALDINRDNWPDIYVTNDFLQPDYLYINNGDGTFTESMEKYFMHMSASSMGSFAGDIDNDGMLDIVEVDMMAEDNKRQKLLMGPMNYDHYHLAVKHGYQHQIMRNQLHLNNGDGTFSEIAHLAGIAHTDWSWTPLMCDFDNDGWNDLFVSNGYRRDLTDMDYRLFLLDSINRHGGIRQFKNIYELLNLLPGTPLRNYFYRNSGDLRFKDVSASWVDDESGFSNGAVYADLDNDGDLDIVVNNIDGYASIYRNNTMQLDEAHYIRFSFKGPGANVRGIGSCVEITISSGIVRNCNYKAQGYHSSPEDQVHFGLGSQKTIDRVIVTWPDGRTQELANVEGDRVVELDYNDAAPPSAEPASEPVRPFIDITRTGGLHFTHVENEFVDFKREPLLLQKHSVSGPCLARGDVNGDGLDDLFVGNAAGGAAALFVQTAGGTFRTSNSALWNREKGFEDTGALFFDSDDDGDQDLLVCGGGSEQPPQDPYYMVRLYENNGKGEFTPVPGRIPAIHTSCNAVAAADLDGDGDKDLFIGGRIVPGRYPESPRSYILRNENGRFTDVTQEVCSDLVTPGLITDALWTDLDDNGRPDLVVAGHWMPVRIFMNNGNELEATSGGAAMDNATGWWNCVKAADMDGDGDMDLVAGNLGLNTRIKGTPEEPVVLHAGDFDENGTIDAVMTMYYMGTSYPVHRREALLDQVRMLQPRFTRFAQYAEATIYDIFPKEQVDQADTYRATHFASTYFENRGDGTFSVNALPLKAQVAPVNAILTGDYNGDGKHDFLMTGNCFWFDVETGRCDAFTGLLLKGDGAGIFHAVPSKETGFYNQLDARSLTELRVKGERWIVAGNNNDAMKVFRLPGPPL